MIYASLDIETTGMIFKDPANMDKVLSVGIVIDNLKAPAPLSKLPKLHLFIDPGGRITFSNPVAEQMNCELVSTLYKLRGLTTNNVYNPRIVEHYTTPEFALGIIFDFLTHHNVGSVDENGVLNEFTVAGKNPMSFDVEFLNNYLMMDTLIRPHYRAMDPAILYLSPTEDTAVPDTKTCKMRAGLNPKVSHTALEDALDIVRLIRCAFGINVETGAKRFTIAEKINEFVALTA